MLSIGACLIEQTTQTFSCELQPINGNVDPAALKITGLSVERLAREGLSPPAAMERFAVWAESFTSSEDNLVFVAFNAPFDWSFVNYYFHKFLGRNPFGFTALDIKAFYMGAAGCDWRDTKSSRMAVALKPRLRGDHQALQDELFRLARESRRLGTA